MPKSLGTAHGDFPNSVVPATLLAERKKIPSSILDFEHHSGRTDFKNIFNALIICQTLFFVVLQLTHIWLVESTQNGL